MDDALGVAIIDTLQDLLEAVGCFLFSKELLLDNLVKELSSCAQFSDKVKVGFILKVFIELEDMWVVKLLQDGYLRVELIYILYLLLANCFARSVKLGDLMSAFSDNSESTTSKCFLADLVDILNRFVIFLDHCLFLDEYFLTFLHL